MIVDVVVTVIGHPTKKAVIKMDHDRIISKLKNNFTDERG
jgi:hypothetical protein